MFVWAPIPSRSARSARSSSPDAHRGSAGGRLAGIGFGEYGEGYVRFALVENEQRIKQALRGLKQLAS